jgi:crotonobetainyl-CoA:carnitine CoA-transferase CaiB-like acyl-CoA transferase
MSTWSSRSVRALVLLHDEEQRKFLETWRRARAAGVVLPDEQTPDDILEHVLRCARWYITWLSTTLEREDHTLVEAPSVARMADEGPAYLDALLAAYAEHFTTVPQAQLSREAGVPWGVSYSVDSLLEHAVTHPRRHRLQLDEQLAATASKARPRGLQGVLGRAASWLNSL